VGPSSCNSTAEAVYCTWQYMTGQRSLYLPSFPFLLPRTPLLLARLLTWQLKVLGQLLLLLAGLAGTPSK